jgi:hypothetical protein
VWGYQRTRLLDSRHSSPSICACCLVEDGSRMSVMGAGVGSNHCTQMLKDFTWRNERASFGKLCSDRGFCWWGGGGGVLAPRSPRCQRAGTLETQHTSWNTGITGITGIAGITGPSNLGKQPEAPGQALSDRPSMRPELFIHHRILRRGCPGLHIAPHQLAQSVAGRTPWGSLSRTIMWLSKDAADARLRSAALALRRYCSAAPD